MTARRKRSGRSTNQLGPTKVAARPTPRSATRQHLFWLASRALGIVAILLLSASVACGLAMSGRMSERPGGAARLKTLHEALTLTALGAIAGHGPARCSATRTWLPG